MFNPFQRKIKSKVSTLLLICHTFLFYWSLNLVVHQYMGIRNSGMDYPFFCWKEKRKILFTKDVFCWKEKREIFVHQKYLYYSIHVPSQSLLRVCTNLNLKNHRTVVLSSVQ